MGKVFLNTLAAVQIDNQIWFSAWNRNGLFKLDMISKDIEFVHKFQNLYADEKGAHSGNIIYDNGNLYIFPALSNKIVVYNIDTKNEISIEIPKCKSETFWTVEAIKIDKKIVFCGEESSYFYELDLETRAIDVLPYEKWVFEKMNQKLLRKMWCKDRFIIAFDDCNYFIDIKNENAELKNYPSNVNVGKRTYLMNDGNGYWLCNRDTWTVYFWEENQVKADEYNRAPNKDIVNQLGTYEKFFVINSDIYLLGRGNNRIYKVNKEKKIVEVCYDYSDLVRIIHTGLGEHASFLVTFCMGENVVFLPRGADKVLLYNAKNGSAKTFPLCIDVTKMLGEYEWKIKEKILSERDFDLRFYLDVLKNEGKS